MALDAGLKVLQKRLAAASQKDGSDAPIEALHSVCDFLIEGGFQHAEIRPLSRLMGALTDHHRGKPHPLLAVKKKGGQRYHEADNMFKCCVAVTAAVLIGAGRRKGQAFKEIAETLQSAGIDVSKSNVDSWHREISNERHSDEGLIQAYRDILDRVTAGYDRQQAAAICLEMLPTLQREKL